MPALKKNNLLIFYSVITNLNNAAGFIENDITAVQSIVASFDYLVISRHTGVDLTNLMTILSAARQINPGLKVFGYTTFGGAVTYSAWLTAMQQWKIDLPAPYSVDGIFLDAFSTDTGPYSRTDQNNAIIACHTNGYSAFVNGYTLYDVFGPVQGYPAAVIGTTGFTDFFLLESYYQSNASLEDIAHRMTRAQYAQAIQAHAKVKAAAIIGAGASDAIDPLLYARLQKELAQYGIGIVGVAPTDLGASSHNWFLKNVANTLGVA